MMKSDEFIKLLSTDHYTRDDLQNVKDICRAYPMFNLAHMLKVRILEKLDLERSADLKLAAVYAADRKKFYEFVNPAPVSHEVTEIPETVKEEEQTGVIQEPPKMEIPEEEIPESAEEKTPSNEISDGERNDLKFSYEEPEHAELIISSDDDQLLSSDPSLLELEQEEFRIQNNEAGIEDEGNEAFSMNSNEEGSEEVEHDPVMQIVEKKEAEMEEPEEVHDPVVPAIDVIEESDIPEEQKEVKLRVEKPKGETLIERFINQEPGPIKADSETSLKGDASRESVIENDHLITDTLAKIYVKQGLHAKAIYAYEKLSLKFPEKSAYFAAQIEKIKNTTNS